MNISDSKGVILLQTEDDTTSPNGGDYFRHWRALRPVSFPVSIHYVAHLQPATSGGGPPYGMKSTWGGVAGAGLGFLLLPENAGTTESKLHWDLSGLPAGSVGVITAGEGDVSLSGPPSKFEEQWMLAGPAEVYKNQAHQFNAYGLGRPPFNVPEEFAWAGQAYDLLTRSFGYLQPAPPYILMMRSVDYKSFGTGTAFTGGA